MRRLPLVFMVSQLAYKRGRLPLLEVGTTFDTARQRFGVEVLPVNGDAPHFAQLVVDAEFDEQPAWPPAFSGAQVRPLSENIIVVLFADYDAHRREDDLLQWLTSRFCETTDAAAADVLSRSEGGELVCTMANETVRPPLVTGRRRILRVAPCMPLARGV